jgi:NAD(P)H dehydrogenase (quinone)
MVKVSIIYHSGHGHTERLAQAVERGARALGSQVHLVPVGEIDAHWPALDESDAIVFGCPTYMGSASAPFKAFMDATGGRWGEQAWKDKLAAGFTNSGSPSGDKFNTLVQLATFAMQHGMVWVSLGSLPGAMLADKELNRLGAFFGAMSVSPHDAAAAAAPTPGDLRTGEALGKRVAELAGRWTRGASAAGAARTALTNKN